MGVRRGAVRSFQRWSVLCFFGKSEAFGSECRVGCECFGKVRPSERRTFTAFRKKQHLWRFPKEAVGRASSRRKGLPSESFTYGALRRAPFLNFFRFLREASPLAEKECVLWSQCVLSSRRNCSVHILRMQIRCIIPPFFEGSASKITIQEVSRGRGLANPIPTTG